MAVRCAAENGAAKDASRSEMVFRCWGADGPGMLDALVKVVMDNDAQVRDMSLFTLEGCLIQTLALSVDSAKSMVLMRALTQCTEALKLQNDFHFPDSSENGEGSGRQKDNVAILRVVSAGDITPALLCDMDKVLSEQNCVVQNITHRSDNKKENNGEYNKMEVRVSCPQALKLSTLSIGPPAAEGGKAVRGLQEVLWEHGAEMSIRWSNSLNGPNGKSLVVFGLSDELYPSDVLDEVLREAGLDPSTAEDGAANVHAVNDAKVAMLAGVRPEVVDRVVARLDFTKGAEMVCGALKRMGFRMAILTNHPMKQVVDHCKRRLGFDYAICRELEVVDGVFTGKYMGDLQDVRFRKEDLLKLMADREAIKYDDVVCIGEPMRGLNASSARRFLETFGQNVYFNVKRHSDLTMVLYLLGFNGSDLRVLRKRQREGGSLIDDAALGDPMAQGAAPAKRVKVQVAARTRDPGQIQKVLAPLIPLSTPAQREVRLDTLRQYSLEDGGMCLGMDVAVGKEDPSTVLKELLLACQKEGFQVMSLKGSEDSASFALKTPEQCWKHYSDNRHILTVVQKPHIKAASLHAILGMMRESSMNVVGFERLSEEELAALSFTVDLTNDLDEGKFSKEIMELSQKLGVDIAFQKDDIDRCTRRLVVFDMDSTLIQQEVIDELARLAGVEPEVKALTEAAMRGELDFYGSLKSRVALLKGHNAEKLFAEVKKNLIFTPGAKKLCSTLRKLGYKTAVISGGFLPVAQEVQRQLGLDYAFANTLEVDETTGLLTGQTQGPVVTPQRKRALLATIASIEGCEVKQTIAVGDGANDIPMLHAAGLGIAFCAKPKVQEASQFRINQKDLSTVLYLMGVSEYAIQHLSAGEDFSTINERSVEET